ncbi:radical SAM protein [Paenibacillus taichungensis]|uniref:Radical SAM protein n=1 Tax=Paenibacillus taichungensis TaxID=484184 RepID=A0ABX2MWT8_9BACL|nr:MULTISPECIES: radical SAM protein [Paenibacillus]MEC0106993.1 radical SAM protein [Paenibacillus taichungensis]MEC0195075.1 radical SAM protein [Paenibacillus taichungensis]NUU58548.1 radical SAM protein [Paenibacillus taichungensis]SEB11129.1 Radical SAM superfamily enzyme, MoaA/NifB/PqqE/SkfB family [Paenibacillus sp. 276b]
MTAKNKYKSLELETPGVYELEGLEVGVTSNCNYKCDYCCAYNRDDGQCISGQEVIRIIRELPRLKRVRLSGGEVTLKYQDCLEIVTYCGEHGIDTQLNTNASLLTEERIHALRDAGLSNIHISFNYTDREAYAAYYRVHPRMYERLEHNIRLCTEAGLETVLETLLFEGTQANMQAISDKVYELGVRIHEIQNSIVMPHSRWSKIASKESLIQSVNDLIKHKKEDTTLYFTCMDRFAEQLGLREQPGVYFSNCVDGTKQLHLHGNGDILICELCHPVVIGNIYEGTSLKDIYTKQPQALMDYLEKQPCPAYDALFAGEQSRL